MKKITLIIGMLVAVFALNAQNQEAYIKAMIGGLEKMGAAQTIEDLQAVAGQFERVAAAAQGDWYSPYYAGLAYTRMSMMAEDINTKDQYSKKALDLAKQAKEHSPNNSEVVALEGYVYMMQLAADPNSRGQMLSPKVMQTFGEAMSLNPKNPRAMALMAQMQFGTAQFFGSSTANACEMAQKSLAVFDSEQQGQSFAPTWGKNVAESLIGQCAQ